MNAFIQRIQELIEDAHLFLRMQRVTIETTAPLTVTLRDGSTVPAVGVIGLTYTAGQPGIAFIADRSQPVVFPTS
jgi:hypothetical protein